MSRFAPDLFWEMLIVKIRESAKPLFYTIKRNLKCQLLRITPSFAIYIQYCLDRFVIFHNFAAEYTSHDYEKSDTRQTAQRHF